MTNSIERDPDETDTARHPFVPSQADSALCDVCGEHRDWHVQSNSIEQKCSAWAEPMRGSYTYRAVRPCHGELGAHMLYGAATETVAWHNLAPSTDSEQQEAR